MPQSITFTGDTFTEIRGQVRQWMEFFSEGEAISTKTDHAIVGEIPDLTNTVSKAKGKTGLKAKTAVKEAAREVEEVAPTPPPVAVTAEVVVTRDDARAALQKVNNTKGLAIARGVLAKFDGASRLGELKDAQLGEFIAECDKALA